MGESPFPVAYKLLSSWLTRVLVPVFYDVAYKVRTQVSHCFPLLNGKLGISLGTQLDPRLKKGHKK